MSGNSERSRKEKLRVNIHYTLRGDTIPTTCPLCGHFGTDIDVELLTTDRFIIYCSFCRKQSEVRLL